PEDSPDARDTRARDARARDARGCPPADGRGPELRGGSTSARVYRRRRPGAQAPCRRGAAPAMPLARGARPQAGAGGDPTQGAAWHERPQDLHRRTAAPMIAVESLDHVLLDLALLFALCIAVVVGFHRIKVPPIAGFLIAGALLGPHALGLVQQPLLVEQLAEIGVVVLL